jgi:hypothetical protein
MPVKEASLQRSHHVLRHLYDTLEKENQKGSLQEYFKIIEL